MAEQKKKKGKGRRAYLDDFQATVSGEYIYTGRTYVLPGGPELRRRRLLQLGGVSAVMAAAAVAGGCVTGPGTGSCAYVLLPYTGSLLSALTVLYGTLRLAKGGSGLRQYVYDATVKQFPLRTMLAAVFSALTIAGECLYAALHGVGGLAGGMAGFLLCQCAVLAGALLFRRLAGGMTWVPRQQDGDALLD